MKKILILLFIIGGFTLNAQSLSQKFSVKDYALKQAEKIQSALDLSETQMQKVLKANEFKAHSIKKYLLLNEKNGGLNGYKMSEAIKLVEEDAERASGYMDDMKRILGEDLFQKYLELFKK